MARAPNCLQQQELSVVTSWSCLGDDSGLWLRASQHLLHAAVCIQRVSNQSPSRIQFRSDVLFTALPPTRFLSRGGFACLEVLCGHAVLSERDWQVPLSGKEGRRM